jgi:hypothetical protein
MIMEPKSSSSSSRVFKAAGMNEAAPDAWRQEGWCWPACKVAVAVAGLAGELVVLTIHQTGRGGERLGLDG